MKKKIKKPFTRFSEEELGWEEMTTLEYKVSTEPLFSTDILLTIIFK